MRGPDSGTRSAQTHEDRSRFLHRTQTLEPHFVRASRRFAHYIPERFRHEVLLHLLLNEIVYRDLLPIPNAPLILGIQGRPGIGKSWEAIGVCAMLDVPVYRLSGASLSGEYEADASEALLAAYLQASTADGPAVLLIDDIDTSPAASFGEGVTYTVNRQLVCGMLMSITDLPTRPPGAPRAVRRVPIIATANDLSKLYPPLLRDGRMAVFDYVQTSDELIQKAVAFLTPHLPNVRRDALTPYLGLGQASQTSQNASHRPLTMASIVQACVICYKTAILSELRQRDLLNGPSLSEILLFLQAEPALVVARLQSFDTEALVNTLQHVSRSIQSGGFLDDD